MEKKTKTSQKLVRIGGYLSGFGALDFLAITLMNISSVPGEKFRTLSDPIFGPIIFSAAVFLILSVAAYIEFKASKLISTKNTVKRGSIMAIIAGIFGAVNVFAIVGGILGLKGK